MKQEANIMTVPGAPPKLNQAVANSIPLYKRITKDELREAIYEVSGMTSLLVVKYDCNFKQVWNAIHKFQLEEELEQAKQMFIEKAKGVLYDALDSEDESVRLKAATTIYSKSQPQTVVQTQINIDKESRIKDIFGIQ